MNFVHVAAQALNIHPKNPIPINMTATLYTRCVSACGVFMTEVWGTPGFVALWGGSAWFSTGYPG